jgi:DNA-binding MarR family transcriptional regulator
VYRTTAEHDGSMSVNLKHVIALSYLRELGAVGQKYFGGVLCLDANNTVLLLNELEAGGMVIRRRDAEDRRRHVVELTETGLDVLRQIEAGMLEIEDELLAALSEEQRAQFRELLHQALYGERGVLRRLAAGVA